MADQQEPKRPGRKFKNLDKPWEDDSVDKWRVDPFEKGDMAGPLTEESSFAVLFPAYREAHLREIWPQVTALLKEHAEEQLEALDGAHEEGGDEVAPAFA